MREVGAYEAKTHLPKLLEQVARGEQFVITKHGVPVARLVPTSSVQKNVTDVIGEIRRFARAHSLGKISLRRLIEEGRR